MLIATRRPEPSLALFSQAPPDKVSGLMHAAVTIARQLGQGRTLDTPALRAAMAGAFGATDAEGAWVWKDAYDAMEAAQVLFLRNYGAALRAGAESPSQMLTKLARVAECLPTQTRRSEESVKLQQFSTPITLGFVAAQAAAITASDLVLEPSAGTGLLAIFAELAGARLALNEIAETRAGLLGRLFRDVPVSLHNAEQIHDRLAAEIRPTVVVLNPPFSASPKMKGRSAEAAFRHLASALARLAPGGRLVAITGHNVGPERPEWRDGFMHLQERGRVVFSAPIAGRAYARHGTSMDTRLTVIDRIPAGDRGVFPRSPGVAASAGELLEWVAELVPPRLQLGALPAPSRAAPIVVRDRGARAAIRRAPVAAVEAEQNGDVAVELGYETFAWEPGATGAAISANLYEAYSLQAVRIAGAKPHPTKLVQSAAMAAVAPPRPSYRPHLPPRLLARGILSDAQLESVIYAGEAHSGFLAGFYTVDEAYDAVEEAAPDAEGAVRFRRGWFLGDGTGAGKGRQVAGIILDNWSKGRRRALWISKSDKLIEDAERDWSAVGGDRSAIVPLGRFHLGTPIELDEGILFTTYATLRTEGRGDKPGRLQQIVEWLGAGFDGAVIFDESHAMANAMAQKGELGIKKASQQGRAGLRLQNALPGARVVYVSATGATTVSNLAYATRLGLWGTGDFPFATREDFLTAMDEGGIAAMEVLARDLKALGLYMARSLSFDGIEYEIVEHRLTAEQKRIYDAYAGAFQIIHNNLEDALRATNITGATGATYNRNAKAAARSAFESNKQRFFNHLLTAMKCPTLLAALQRDLDEGHAPVVQLVSTSEALMDRRLAEIPTEEWGDLSVDITPREYVLDYLRHSFPIQLFEVHQSPDGATFSVPAYDEAGQRIVSQEARECRDAMLEHLAGLPPVQSALDQILHHFGTDVVAEVTGRSRRIVRRPAEHGGTRLCVESRAPTANYAETTAFMDDQKRILVFSDAGGTGRSYHADLGCRNQRRRVHYLLEPGWRADAAIQGLGRSNRTNQAHPPIFRPVATDVKGEKRFLSTISRRLDTLGALTRGQRQTGGQGLFRAEGNLESQYARAALRELFVLICLGKVAACSLGAFEAATGLELVDHAGSLRDELPPIRQFLNRCLALEIDLQNDLFAVFENLLQARIEGAIAGGTYDVGVETLVGEEFRVIERHKVYEHTTGAATCCFRVRRKTRNRPLRLPEALETKARRAGSCFVVNEQSGRAAVQSVTCSWTNEVGAVETKLQLLRPTSREYFDAADLGRSSWRSASVGEFSRAWERECTSVPAYTESELHVVTGLLLPIWDRLRSASMRVVRFETVEGERVIGRVVSAEALPALYAWLGGEGAPVLSAPDAWEAVVQRGATLNLGELSVRRSTVMGAARVELLGFSEGQVPHMKALGLHSEIAGWRLRLFFPMDEAKGPAILDAVLARHPLVSVRPARGAEKS